MPTRSRFASTILPFGIVGLLSVMLFMSGCGGGSGSGGGAASFSVARGIAADSGGNVYVAGDTDGALGDDSANGVITDGNGMIYAAGGSSISGGPLGYLVVKYDSAGIRR